MAASTAGTLLKVALLLDLVPCLPGAGNQTAASQAAQDSKPVATAPAKKPLAKPETMPWHRITRRVCSSVMPREKNKFITVSNH